MSSLLVWLILVPIVGAFVCIPLSNAAAKWIALVSSLIGSILGCVLFVRFDAEHASTLQMVWEHTWISSAFLKFAVGIDGLSFPLVILTKGIMPIAILSSWSEVRRTRAFMICYLILDAAMTGTFLATDIGLFYVFWEVMLIPMLLLIGVWGSKDRIYASLKFFIYTFSGSVLMLAGIAWLLVAHSHQFGFASSDIKNLINVSFRPEDVFLGLSGQDLMFWAFSIAFLIKIPLFPLHTWLPDAHVQAPTGGSVLLAAVLLKMGAYGLLRFAIPLCPTSFVRFSGLLITLSVIGIFYGAWVAYQQSDMKKLVAYSSVSHLAYVVLGISALNVEGLTGAMMQMINHGISTGALFAMVRMLYERRHTRDLNEFGGLASTMPWYSFFLVFTVCSSMGVPGLNGFIGEYLVLLGIYKHQPLVCAIASLGVVFGAAYLLIMVRKTLFGEVTMSENRGIADLTRREIGILIPLCFFMVLLGVSPKSFMQKFELSLENYWATSLRMNLPGPLTNKPDLKSMERS